MTPTRVIHLVDDTTPGGVMRMLNHLLTLPEMHGAVQQLVKVVSKSAVSLGRQDADVIVSHLALSWRALPPLMALRALNPSARILHVEHSYTRAFTALNVKNKTRFYAMLRTSYALFDGVVAVSEGQSKWLIQRALVRKDALSVLRPQVDLSEFEALAPPDPSTRVIGAFGRLEPQKGFDILIQVFLLVRDPDARLMIFGDGSEHANLRDMAKGDPRISFRGHCNDLAGAYRETNLVAMPSRWEAFGLVAQEAQAAGRYVLASDVDGLSDQASELIQLQSDFSITAWAQRLEGMLAFEQLRNGQRPPQSAMLKQQNYATQWLHQFQSAKPFCCDTKPEADCRRALSIPAIAGHWER